MGQFAWSEVRAPPCPFLGGASSPHAFVLRLLPCSHDCVPPCNSAFSLGRLLNAFSHPVGDAVRVPHEQEHSSTAEGRAAATREIELQLGEELAADARSLGGGPTGRAFPWSNGGGVASGSVDYRFGDSLLGSAMAGASQVGDENVHFEQAGHGRSDAAGGSADGTGDGHRMVVNFDTLLYAVQNGDVFLVQTWLHNVDQRAAELLNKNPSLLNRAVFGQHEVMVRMLLEAKADPDACHITPAGTPAAARPFGGEAWPLRLAVQHGYTDICRLLLEHNARIEPPNNRGALAGMTTSDDDSGGLLGTAAFKGHIEILELLLDTEQTSTAAARAATCPTS